MFIIYVDCYYSSRDIWNKKLWCNLETWDCRVVRSAKALSWSMATWILDLLDGAVSGVGLLRWQILPIPINRMLKKYNKLLYIFENGFWRSQRFKWPACPYEHQTWSCWTCTRLSCFSNSCTDASFYGSTGLYERNQSIYLKYIFQHKKNFQEGINVVCNVNTWIILNNSMTTSHITSLKNEQKKHSGL